MCWYPSSVAISRGFVATWSPAACHGLSHITAIVVIVVAAATVIVVVAATTVVETERDAAFNCAARKARKVCKATIAPAEGKENTKVTPKKRRLGFDSTPASDTCFACRNINAL